MRSSTLTRMDELVDQQRAVLDSGYAAIDRLEKRMALVKGTDQYNVLGARFDNLFMEICEGEVKLSALIHARNEREYMEEEEGYEPDPF